MQKRRTLQEPCLKQDRVRHSNFQHNPQHDLNLGLITLLLDSPEISDTTNSVVSSAILAMTAYPEVTLKAQEELDRVVGRDRRE